MEGEKENSEQVLRWISYMCVHRLTQLPVSVDERNHKPKVDTYLMKNHPALKDREFWHMLHLR